MVAVKRPKNQSGWGSQLSEGQQKQYKQAKQAEHDAVGITRKAQESNDSAKESKAIKHELSSADHAQAFRDKHKPKED